jgi:predicted anti-sigma-YlaC factor YlaD
MWCKQVRNQLSAYVDGELNTQRAQAVEMHLSQCEGCSRESETVGGVRRLTAAIPLEELPTGLHAGIMARLADEMAASARAFRPAPRRLSPWALMGLAGAAAAATVFVQHQARLSTQPDATQPTVSVSAVAVAPKHHSATPGTASVSKHHAEHRLAAALIKDKGMQEAILPVERPKPKPENARTAPTSIPVAPVAAVSIRPARAAAGTPKERNKPVTTVVASETKPMDAGEAPMTKPVKMTMMAAMTDPGKGMEKPADITVGTLTPQPVIIINESATGREDEGVDILRMALEQRNRNVPQPPSLIPARPGRSKDSL